MLAFLSSAAFAGEAIRPDKPNIVLVVIDSLRADHTGCYGYERPTTPFLDRLAAAGIRFERHFATSSAGTPALTSLVTGLSPIRHGVHHDGQKPSAEFPSLAGTLKEAGYATVAVVPNAFLAGAASAGFDIWDDYSIAMELEESLFSADLIDQRGKRTALDRATGLDDKTVTAALRQMRKVPAGQPFFLLVLLHDPHAGYRPKPETKALFADPDYAGGVHGVFGFMDDPVAAPATPADHQHLIDLYDAEVRQADQALDRLVTSLRERGRLADSDLLAVVGSHGEEFMEHGGLSHGRHLHDEVLRTPLVLAAPAWLPRGRTVSALSSHGDVLPTLAAAAGLSAPQVLPGTNWLAVALGAAPPERDAVFAHVVWTEPPAPGAMMTPGHHPPEHPLIAARTATMKVIHHLDTNEARAYNLAADPKEQKPLVAASDPAHEKRLTQLDQWYTHEKKLAGLE